MDALQYVPRRWLLRSRSPYVDEESAIADMLDLPAPGFSTALNPAPLRRRTLDPRLRPFDLAANLVTTLRRSRVIPADHLLRRVFETTRLRVRAGLHFSGQFSTAPEFRELFRMR